VLDTIRQFFEKNIRGETRDDASSEHRLRVATAALLVEMARMSTEVTEEERETVWRAVQDKFDLSAEETRELMHLGEEEAREATDYFQFTSLINESFTAEQKVRLVEHLWRVAYADGHLHMYEEHLVRKIADLIHVPHKAFIAAKLRARESAT
jgi:uncharacterized tellurite resistance protein B-like protein